MDETGRDANARRDIVVVGASAGGVEALKSLVRDLPAGLRSAIFVVLHVPASGTSVLPQILERAGRLPAAHARDGEPIEHGRIYVAPPDLHLLVERDTVRAVPGPKENGARPAIDPLFRTAAGRFGARVVGVVLSGTLDDGSAGLAEIRDAGGLAVVQDPDEALYPTMPSSAIDRVGPDHVLPVAAIAAVIAASAPRGNASESHPEAQTMSEDLTQLPPEAVLERNEARGLLSGYTCPECSGALWELRRGDVVSFRCRVGHAYGEEALLAHQHTALENALWTALTALEEKADFARRLSERFRRQGHELGARRYEDQSRNAKQQAELVRRAVLDFAAPAATEEQVS